MRVGQVKELWRYPVKSMGGDRIHSTSVTEQWGVPGDRGWALRDEQAAEIRGAKRLTSLMQFHAHYLAEPSADATPAVEITCPDGTRTRSDDAGIHEALSTALGREVTLWPRRPVEDVEHYRRGRFDMDELREQLGLGPDDPFPDFSSLPKDVLTELASFSTPRGTYFDTFPLSLLTTASMDSLASSIPDAAIDSRRFRKNVILDAGAGTDGQPELDWIGRQLQVGEAVCEVVMPISRCVMVTLPQADLPHDRTILRSLAKNFGMELGVYLRIVTPGSVREGDEVRLL